MTRTPPPSLLHRSSRWLVLASAAIVLVGGATHAQLRSAKAKKVGGASSLTAIPLHTALDLQVELAGVRTDGFPHFTYVSAFNELTPIEISIDTADLPNLVGHAVDVYLVAHRTPAEWLIDPSLTDAVGGPLRVTPHIGGRRTNTIRIDAGTLRGGTGTPTIGVGYDVVLDANRNGMLDRADRIDGWGAEAGLYVVPDLTRNGPYATRERLYNGGQWLRQDVYFPAPIGQLGELPLVVISHGNGHNYQWYDHLGRFLASWGYIVMSHSNNTGPGIETASTTTLQNTEHFLTNLDLIASGQLEGHVDGSTIVWIGHSRGGEGVARAYNRLVAGTALARSYGPEDIKLVSSIAPTDFLGVNRSNPLDVPYHLWTGGADADVNGCASSDIAQTFHLHDRAQSMRMSTSYHGVGHGDFHAGGGSSVAAGPCLNGRVRTHKLMKGYLLPLLAHVLEGNVPCKDFLWRQWESLRPLGAPTHPCVVVDLMYQDPIEERRVVDDFQSNPSVGLSSSGGRVEHDLSWYNEHLLNDRNFTFTHAGGDPTNGMTSGGAGDTTAGVTFSWHRVAEKNFALFEVHREIMDVSNFEYLSFRATQTTRSPTTAAELGDVTFAVELFDLFGHSSMIRIGSYGGGIEEPYQRGGCGAGRGWANEWETVRIPLADFTADGRRLEMRGVIGIAFHFGERYGSALGRIGLDDIEFTRN